MRFFISGGCKNGKSYHSQRLAQQQQGGGPLYYIATMSSVDREDDARIVRHRQEREGWGFTTLEQPRRIEGILDKCDKNGSFLLDSLTALLANEMFPVGEAINENAHEKIASGLVQVLSRVSNIVIVSDYIYNDALLYDPLTEKYRKSLAALDRLAALHCDAVMEAVYTRMIIHKGEDVAGFAPD